MRAEKAGRKDLKYLGHVESAVRPSQHSARLRGTVEWSIRDRQ
jgi:hypothetical protein